MRFQVPQFIEVEDKIVGPLTIKQFVYLAGGAGIVMVFFSFLPKFLAAVVSLPFVIFSVALAFYKVNNRPFIAIVESIFSFFIHPRLYIWRKEDKPVVGKERPHTPDALVPRLSKSKLKDLTWSLDVKENTNPTTND